jgi:hypothetical protein
MRVHLQAFTYEFFLLYYDKFVCDNVKTDPKFQQMRCTGSISLQFGKTYVYKLCLLPQAAFRYFMYVVNSYTSGYLATR